MAHTLAGYDGPCREIHGHSYKLFVTVKGEPVADAAEPKYGMVMDFGELKRIVGRLIVDRYDHALVMRATADNGELIRTLRGNYAKIEVVDYQPTCENMVARFAAAIEKRAAGRGRTVFDPPARNGHLVRRMVPLGQPLIPTAMQQPVVYLQKTFSKEEFPFENLSGAEFERCSFTECDFSYVNLSGRCSPDALSGYAVSWFPT